MIFIRAFTRLAFGILFAALPLVFQGQSAQARPDDLMPSLTSPYAAIVIDARTGAELYSTRPDKTVPPTALFKMLTLYVAFQALESGQVTPDTMVRVSPNAAHQPPPRLGLLAGQDIALRNLIRATAVKSANDATLALAETIAGSEAAFVARMRETAQNLGLTNTQIASVTGVGTQKDVTSPRDMAVLGRHLLYDFPAQFHLFSAPRANAGVKMINASTRRLLTSYAGAEGIKSGYS
ncbi:MAG TPA: D-alanyl-D-alanine carboxypeptidase, partial [Aliiroseovarius sp.]|nr:D-alanyl-D-alanine carboxypeptidase [Aliiroseovarius sp.]